MTTRMIGARIPRNEDPRLLRGLGSFVDDVNPKGVLHAACLRSPHAHARLRRLDCRRARALRGVHLVLTAVDLGHLNQPGPLLIPHPHLLHPRTQRPLAVDEVRGAWGPISGVIHAAGVVADRRIGDKTHEQFDAVFETKVKGLRALLEATRPDPLRWILLFSSVAARLGNAGQSDYAMANEVLNKVAAFEAQQRPDCTVRSLCWGPWESGMVTPSLRRCAHLLGNFHPGAVYFRPRHRSDSICMRRFQEYEHKRSGVGIYR